MNLKNKRAAVEMSFAWIFAIIAGSIIILLAIYATSKFVTTTQYATQSESAKELLNLLNPVVNGITSASATQIDFKKDTRVYLHCSASSEKSPIFGKETLAFAEQSAFFSKWGDPGANVSRYNKYIFSNDVEEGKTMYIFAKPFYTGFEVDDLIFMNSENYCFIAPPSTMQNEIQDLGLKNVNVSTRIDLCSAGTVKVCFGNTFSGCNISVIGDCNDNYCQSEYDTGSVVKNGVTSRYIGNLIYAAIFSSPDIYECNVERLAKKINQLAIIYKAKLGIVKTKECNSVIGPELDQLVSLTSGNMTSSKLTNIRYEAAIMDSQNSVSDCMIYAPE